MTLKAHRYYRQFTALQQADAMRPVFLFGDVRHKDKIRNELITILNSRPQYPHVMKNEIL